MSLKIHTSDKLNYAPCFEFVAAAWAEMVASGTAPRECALYADQRVIWATSDDEIVGAISWFVQDSTETAFEQLAYVAASHRVRGVYRRMLAAFEGEARRAKCRRAAGGTSWRNSVMRGVVLRTGRTFDAAYYSKEL